MCAEPLPLVLLLQGSDQTPQLLQVAAGVLKRLMEAAEEPGASFEARPELIGASASPPPC